MWDKYAPDPRMRLNLGIRRRLAPLLDGDVRKIRLSNSLLLTLPGSPIIYYGDEIGMGDNIWLADRNGVRTPMQWSADDNAGFSKAEAPMLYSPLIEGYYGPERVNVAAEMAEPSSLWHAIRHMLHTRKGHRAFGWGELDWVESANDHIAAFWRRFEDERILAIHNLTESEQTLAISEPAASSMIDLLTNEEYVLRAPHPEVRLAPYQYLWLRAA